jgi:hypothetical protein
MKKTTIANATASCYVLHTDGGKKFYQYGKQYQDAPKSHNAKVIEDIEEGVHLNMIQRPMYRRLIYGMKDFSDAQRKAMSPKAIHRINTDHERATRFLHIMKAKRYMEAETKLINAIFGENSIRFDKDCDWMEPLPSGVTLRSLKFTTADVINELIIRKLLPANFLSINEQTPVL